VDFASACVHTILPVNFVNYKPHNQVIHANQTHVKMVVLANQLEINANATVNKTLMVKIVNNLHHHQPLYHQLPYHQDLYHQ
jgi:hypothetical protein